MDTVERCVFPVRALAGDQKFGLNYDVINPHLRGGPGRGRPRRADRHRRRRRQLLAGPFQRLNGPHPRRPYRDAGHRDERAGGRRRSGAPGGRRPGADRDFDAAGCRTLYPQPGGSGIWKRGGSSSSAAVPATPSFRPTRRRRCGRRKSGPTSSSRQRWSTASTTRIPHKYPDAVKYTRLTVSEVLNRSLGVMDATRSLDVQG